MIRLSTTADASAAVSGARSVDVLAYTLRRGPLLDALEAAALRGACVRVRLEGAPFGDPGGQLATHNRRIAGELARCGADAQLARSTPGSRGDLPVHAKALVADGRLFLDDRNWGANDFVVADSDRNAVREVSAAVETGAARDATDATFAFSKRGALQREAELLRAARTGDDVVVESESFGYGNPVYAALDRPRAPRSQAALARVVARGAQRARTCCARAARSRRRRRSPHECHREVRARRSARVDRVGERVARLSKARYDRLGAVHERRRDGRRRACARRSALVRRSTASERPRRFLVAASRRFPKLDAVAVAALRPSVLAPQERFLPLE